MSKPKKGALHQILVPLVDATDFASVESGITESDFNSGVTKKFYGVNTGGSAATTSGTISKAGSLVRSGVFRITLKGTENNYDQMMVRINKTGTAEQIVVWENVDNDDSDIVSYLAGMSNTLSGVAVNAAAASSRALLIQSDASQINSYLIALSGLISNIDSQVNLNASAIDDVKGRTSVLLSDTSQITSYLVGMSNALSATQVAAVAGASRALIVQSDASQINSYLVGMSNTLSGVAVNAAAAASRALLVQSDTSQINSYLVVMNSDLASKIGTVSVALTASQIDTIASQVVAGVGLDASDIASAVWADTIGARVDSRVLVIKSNVSDVPGLVWDVVRASHATAGTFGDIDTTADIASAVWVDTVGARVDSRVLIIQSHASQIESLLSDVSSDVNVGTSKLVVLTNAVSDVASDVNVLTATISDLGSDVGVLTSKVIGLSNEVSDAHSDLKSYLVAMNSDLGSKVGTVSVGFDASDVASSVWAHTVGTRVDSRLLLTQSMASAAQTQATAAASRALLVQSDTSQINSYLVGMSDTLSDVYAMLSDVSSDVGLLASDIKSAITVAASDVKSAVTATASDVKSAVVANGILAAGSEPTTVVGHTDSLKAKIDWLAALSRNKITQTTAVQSLRNDADNSTIASAAVGDDGSVFTRGEWGS